MNKREFQLGISTLFDSVFKAKFNKLKQKGIIKPFDDDFYSQFDGMLYNATPIDYYLKCMSMGRCYDASAVLGLAFGKSEEVYVCRGNLLMAGLSVNGTTSFGHGWVERGDFAYDTTWKVIMPKKVYYKLFGVKVYNKRTTKQFFEDCKHISDFNIHDKKYYEENFVLLAYTTLVQLYNAGEMYKQYFKNERAQALGQKLLNDLPDIEKVYSVYKNARLEIAGSSQSESENE